MLLIDVVRKAGKYIGRLIRVVVIADFGTLMATVSERTTKVSATYHDQVRVDGRIQTIII